MQNVIRTVYGAHIQTCQYLGKPVNIKPFTTLNEKHDITVQEVISETEIPKIGYLAIGNKGHKFTINGDGVAIPSIVQHRATDAALYNQLPFILRETVSDLTPAERAKYAHRKVITVNDVDYIAYYLKRIDTASVIPELNYRTVTTDPDTNTTTVVTETFTPNSSNLSPVAPVIANDSVTETTGDYITATAKITFSLSETDVQEILNACNIIYGDEAYAMISEIGICSGVDRIYELTYNGVTSNYKEANFVQVTSFISTFISLPHSTDGINSILDVGSTEPLLFGR